MTAVVYGCNEPGQAKLAISWLRKMSNPELTHIVLVDNGSDVPFEQWDADQLVRYDENQGGNNIFHALFRDEKIAKTRFIGFFHNDLVIRERGWDERVVREMIDRDLWLSGFVGSSELDERGGRGGGTALNYLGAFYEGIGQSSRAEQHGRREMGVMAAAVLDHCSLIFATDKLLQLTPQEGNYAPEHFYDRILCCEVLEKGGRIAVIGVSCDHFGGGIGAGTPKADALRKKWLEAEGIPYDPARSDLAVYFESEKRFHRKYLDSGFIPLKVHYNFRVEHQHVLRGGFWKPS